jgi:quercetin dioxygenase-like cupin family protein
MSVAESDLQQLRPLRVSERPVYVVAGGDHVTLLLDREVSAGLLDVIDVLAQPGGGPPPHRHAFAEWFCVLEGELTISEERDGTVVCTAR